MHHDCQDVIVKKDPMDCLLVLTAFWDCSDRERHAVGVVGQKHCSIAGSERFSPRCLENIYGNITNRLRTKENVAHS